MFHSIMGNRIFVRRSLFIVLLAAPLFILAQSTTSPAVQSDTVKVKTGKKRSGEIYFSWGYNTEWYTHSNVKINQPALGNDFTFEDISGHDHKGWDEGIFNKAISIPQYNYRLGYIFNEKKGLGIEINFDHTKFIFGD